MLFFAFLFSGSFAQEGMWLLSQIDQLKLEEKGLDMSPSDIYSPGKPALYQAIVQLGGGTASFVSPEGLLVTNHHVAYGAIQRTSSVNSNYLEEGFLAGNRSDEIPAPGYQAMKNYQGKVEGMQRTNYVEKKLDFEKDFMAWVNADAGRKARYSSLLDDIKKQYDILAKTKTRDNVLNYMNGLSGTLLILRARYKATQRIEAMGRKILELKMARISM